MSNPTPPRTHPANSLPEPGRRLRREERNSLAWDLAMGLRLDYLAGKYGVTTDYINRLRYQPSMKGLIDQCVEMRGFHSNALVSIIKLQGAEIIETMVGEAKDPSSKNYMGSLNNCLPHLLPSTKDPDVVRVEHHFMGQASKDFEDRLKGFTQRFDGAIDAVPIEDDPNLHGGSAGLPSYDVPATASSWSDDSPDDSPDDDS